LGANVITIRNTVENVAGRLCKKLFPIKQEYYQARVLSRQGNRYGNMYSV